MQTLGLVLSGGGARGAYQVGVLSAIAHISQELKIERPFKIYTGISAGAINASYLAAGLDDFATTTKNLVDLWSNIQSEQVFYTGTLNIGKIGLGWLEELSLGAFLGTTPGRSLLNTTPLKELIQKNVPFENIQTNIDRGHLHSLAITATEYKTSRGVVFVQGRPNSHSWNKARHHSENTTMQAEHILASSAIPLLFPPIQVDNRWYGDGCVRNQSPCGPALYLGAEKIMVIGVRRNSQLLLQSDTNSEKQAAPSVARVANVLLNSVMLDGVETDLERIRQINDFVDRLPKDQSKTFRKVNFAFVSPSGDIGQMAFQKSSKLPRIIRYLLKGLGSMEDASEIISYLLFDPSFCTQLIELGFADGMKKRDDIVKFITE